MAEPPEDGTSKDARGSEPDSSGGLGFGSEASPKAEGPEQSVPPEATQGGFGSETPESGPTGSETETGEPTPGSHTGWGVNDQRTDEDHLDFETHVSILHEFLTHERTKPPLTVSIEGEWGTGKSSFMALLRKALESDEPHAGGTGEGASTDGGSRYFTVEFNPWRHEREDALWAAFMLEFFHQVTDQLGFVDRWRGHLGLARRRLQWRHGWRDLLRLGLVVPLVLLAVWFPSVATELGLPLNEFGQAVGRGVTVVALGVWTWQNVANPIETELRAYIADPGYENRVSFIERFHSDFDDILDAYVGHEARVFVFIDDLDRCPPSKAAELVQSINLMISSGDPRVFFLLGMDREKVAAGLAAKHEGLLEYLRASERRYAAWETPGTSAVSGAPETADTPDLAESLEPTERTPGTGATERGSAGRPEYSTEAYGLEFADKYLEKFVQIPFLIPKPRETGIGNLVREMVGEDERAASAGGDGIDSIGGDDGGDRGASGTESEEEVLPEAEIVRIGEMVAPAFDYNPRMVKTFVNLFRLRTMLATELGLFEDGSLTTERLAKFVAIGLEWPPLTASLRDPERARRLTAWALDEPFFLPNGELGGPPPEVDRLSKRERARLSDLLAAGVHEYEDGERYRLAELPEELFWISPRIDTPSRTVEEAASDG